MAAITLVAAGLAVVLAFVLGCLGYLGTMLAFDGTTQTQLSSVLTPGTTPSTTLLVASITTATANGGFPTDSLVLVHVDGVGHRVWQLWIPSDIRTDVPGHGSMSLGDVHRLGGPASTVRAVRRLTGLPINEYAEVRSTALARAVDTVGGVWVNVPSGAAASEASSTTQALMVGSQRLSGADALAFALATTTVDPVFARIRNQGLVVSALGSALSARTTSPLALLTKIAPCTKTSMGLGELSGTLSSAGSAGKFGVFSAVVTGQRQQRFVVPDSVALSRLVGDMRNERPFDVPSATLGQAAADAASAVSSKPPSQVTVTVRNGAGLSGAAKQAAGLLQTHGFVIAGTGNANMNVYPHTLVVYKSDPAVADLVAQYLQPGVRIVRSYGLYSFKSEILLMIGKDWDISRAPVVEIKAQ